MLKDKRKSKNGDPMDSTTFLATKTLMWGSILFLFVSMVVGSLSYYFYWTFNVAPPQPTVDPLFIPTARPTTVVATAVPDFWADWEFMDSSQAIAALQLPNVVNFAVVDDAGRLSFSQDYSLVFTGEAPWQRAERPLAMETLTLTGSSVSFELQGLHRPVVMNVLQPFVLASNHLDLVYLVDLEGSLWSIPAEQAEWVDIETVVTGLTQLAVTISPNSSLTIDIESR